MPYSLAIHGGAGTILKENMTPEKEQAYLQALRKSLEIGANILAKNGSALDAVEEAVKIMEDSPLFNAGRGSVFTHDGRQEMDASIMCGKSLDAGAIAGVEGVRYPISLAREVMANSDFVFLSGKGAHQFALKRNQEIMEAEWFRTEFRFQQLKDAKHSNRIQLDHSEKKDQKFGTVGAVAFDQHGNLAAATSTGGMTNKQFGRIGDSPIIGTGTYANNQTCAVSCTGYGEYFIRGVVAYDVSCLIEYKGLSLEEACQKVIFEKQVNLGGEGGLIAVDRFGNTAMPFNSAGMYRASINEQNKIQIGIYKDT